MALWPDTLPQPKALMFQAGSTARVVQTYRAFRAIPNATISVDSWELSYYMTHAEYAIWRTFYEDTINRVDKFDMPLPNGAGLTTQFVRLKTEPKELDDYPMMILTIEIECFDRATMSAAAVDAALGV